MAVGDSLPTLDFAKFTHGTHGEKQQLGRALAQSFIDHGFVKLVNHGLPDETITDLLDLVCQVVFQCFLSCARLCSLSNELVIFTQSHGHSLHYRCRSGTRLLALAVRTPSVGGAAWALSRRPSFDMKTLLVTTMSPS